MKCHSSCYKWSISVFRKHLAHRKECAELINSVHISYQIQSSKSKQPLIYYVDTSFQDSSTLQKCFLLLHNSWLLSLFHKSCNVDSQTVFGCVIYCHIRCLRLYTAWFAWLIYNMFHVSNLFVQILWQDLHLILDCSSAEFQSFFMEIILLFKCDREINDCRC